MKLILLHQPSCIGCGSCTDIAAAYFVMDHNGKASLFDGRTEKDCIAVELFPGDEELVASAIACCPSRSIRLS